MTAMKLMGELSFTLGPEAVKNQVSPQVVTLAGDPHTPRASLLECVSY
jgi:hypothetical protein